MPESDSTLVFVLVAIACLVGFHGERWRAKLARRKWRSKQCPENVGAVAGFAARPATSLSDPTEQFRLVMEASFEKRRLLSKSEARVFYAAEKAVKDQKLTWRVMAQVSLGEILSSPNARAYSAINSKRVDILLITSFGEPVAAIEYQGSGHYQGTAPARDAVKKEALRRAGVRYIEVTTEHGPEDLAREIARIAAAVSSKSAVPA